MTFLAACDILSEPIRTRVHAQLHAWRPHQPWAQVVENIERETALSDTDYAALLDTFGQALAGGTDAAQAWKNACHSHQFRGAVFASPSCPSVVGRAMAAKNYANLIAQAPDSQLTSVQAEKVLQRYAGQPVPQGVERKLRQSLLGRYVIWATFNATAPTANPFDRLSHAIGDILTALGLGDRPVSEAMVLVAYRPISASQPQALHRPTIADAAGYPYYRAYSDPVHSHGYTGPLSPNPSGLLPQPEVVHREITGEGLLFPFHLTTI